MKLYRLSTAEGKSKYGNPPLTWAVGVTHSIPEAERGNQLCRRGLLHAYLSVPQALLQDPGDANYGLAAIRAGKIR